MTMTVKHVYTLPYKYGHNFLVFINIFHLTYVVRICQVNKYNFGVFYIDFEHDMSGCDPEFRAMLAYMVYHALKVKYISYFTVMVGFFHLSQ